MTFNHTWNLPNGQILNFIKLKIDDDEIAEDILQEVGIKLFEGIGKKIEIKNYKNWLFQVTRNTISDFYRKQKREATFINNQSKNTYKPSTSVCDLASFVIQNYVPEKCSLALYLSDIEQKS
jgi:RNA polymerase sigma-70 factor (ECF subfamily)